MATDKRKQATEDIIKATIESISANGLSGATIRDIAQRADVNTAAINYYFGSRDILIQAALNVSLENAFDIHEFEFNSNTSPGEILKTYLNHWRQGMITYEGLTRAHFDAILNQTENAQMITSGFNAFIDGIYKIMVAHGLSDSVYHFQKLRIIFGSFISSMLFPNIFCPVSDKDAIVDFLVSQFNLDVPAL